MEAHGIGNAAFYKSRRMVQSLFSHSSRIIDCQGGFWRNEKSRVQYFPATVDMSESENCLTFARGSASPPNIA